MESVQSMLFAWLEYNSLRPPSPLPLPYTFLSPTLPLNQTTHIILCSVLMLLFYTLDMYICSMHICGSMCMSICVLVCGLCVCVYVLGFLYGCVLLCECMVMCMWLVFCVSLCVYVCMRCLVLWGVCCRVLILREEDMISPSIKFLMPMTISQLPAGWATHSTCMWLFSYVRVYVCMHVCIHVCIWWMLCMC